MNRLSGYKHIYLLWSHICSHDFNSLYIQLEVFWNTCGDSLQELSSLNILHLILSGLKQDYHVSTVSHRTLYI